MKKRWMWYCILICALLTACAKGNADKVSTSAKAEESKKEEVLLKEIWFHDIGFQIPEEYKEELVASDVICLAKSENSSIVLKYACNQEKNMTKEYALGEYAATKMLEIAKKYPQAIFVESSIVDTEYGYYLKLSYEMVTNEKLMDYQVFYPMMESYDLVIECFDAKDYECISYQETAKDIATNLVIKETVIPSEQEDDTATLATEIEMQNK